MMVYGVTQIILSKLIIIFKQDLYSNEGRFYG
jgi:hypothetical protein